MKYFDDDGNEHELDISPDDIPKMKEEKERLAKEKAEIEERHKGLQDELEKLRAKDHNFSNLRKLTKEQQEEMLKEFSVKEKSIIEEMANIKEELNEYKNRNFQSHKEFVLKQLVGDDEDLRKQIEDTAKSFAGEPKSESDVSQRLANAFTLVKGNRPQINPLNQFVPTGSNQDLYASQKKEKDWTKTPDGEDFYSKTFPQFSKKDKK